ncbi:hypothetical protein F5884DRAFT_875578 [Xylogone sp. PMI_703]|nr:hypothetical protein F5884DRAFT_875578 [Xylogone sp. PMI_703]
MVTLQLQLLCLLVVAHSVVGSITSTQVKAASAQAANHPVLACCLLLEDELGSKISFPHSASYNVSVLSYWSEQDNGVEPTCIISPNVTADVSVAVGTINELKRFDLECSFAIRGGGHTPFAAATIEDGIVIDLSAINQVTVAEDHTVTSVGPGVRWIDAYLKLDAMGLAIAGGRVASVGVGGLTTGGGVSFFSPRTGFVCDSAVNFEVVLANGSVVNANHEENSDLWYALKGGSNNFGAVTRFDFKTFNQGLLWGGSIVFPIETLPEQLSAFVNFASTENYDPYASLINSVGYVPAAGTMFVSNSIVYTAPVANPPAFQQYTSITPQLSNTMRISNLSDFALELNAGTPYGFRQIFYTGTYANDLGLLTQIVKQLNESMQVVNPLKSLVNYAMSLEPLPTTITKWGAQTGGNVLGLDPSDGDQVLVLLGVTWSDEADDIIITNAVTDMFTKFDAYAASKHGLNPYTYLNYAYKTQKPIQGYGVVNVKKLQAISKKYDPSGIFQKLVPGGFKLFTS